jgi:hypothetical protein
MPSLKKDKSFSALILKGNTAIRVGSSAAEIRLQNKVIITKFRIKTFFFIFKLVINFMLLGSLRVVFLYFVARNIGNTYCIAFMEKMLDAGFCLPAIASRSGEAGGDTGF